MKASINVEVTRDEYALIKNKGNELINIFLDKAAGTTNREQLKLISIFEDKNFSYDIKVKSSLATVMHYLRIKDTIELDISIEFTPAATKGIVDVLYTGTKLTMPLLVAMHQLSNSKSELAAFQQANRNLVELDKDGETEKVYREYK